MAAVETQLPWWNIAQPGSLMAAARAGFVFGGTQGGPGVGADWPSLDDGPLQVGFGEAPLGFLGVAREGRRWAGGWVLSERLLVCLTW